MDFVHYQPPIGGTGKVQGKTPCKSISSSVAAASKTDRSCPQLYQPGTNGVCSQRANPDQVEAPIQIPVEFEDMATRPRLAPEQVWLLEQQFQAHPKPSSHTKRQLADLTNLSLPRVAVSGASQHWMPGTGPGKNENG